MLHQQYTDVPFLLLRERLNSVELGNLWFVWLISPSSILRFYLFVIRNWKNIWGLARAKIVRWNKNETVLKQIMKRLEHVYPGKQSVWNQTFGSNFPNVTLIKNFKACKRLEQLQNRPETFCDFSRQNKTFFDKKRQNKTEKDAWKTRFATWTANRTQKTITTKR